MTTEYPIDMQFEGYLARLAVEPAGPEPVALYLVDIPGCSVQAATLPDAVDRMGQAVAQVLAAFRAEGKALPPPSPTPILTFANVGLVSVEGNTPEVHASESEFFADVGEPIISGTAIPC